MSIVNREARAELSRAVSERYRSSSKEEKTRILDEFVRLTGYHRKHAVRALRGQASDREPKPGSKPTVYDEAVRQAVVVLWEASDRICGKRLRPLLPLLLDAPDRHGHLRIDSRVRDKLLRASASTLERQDVRQRR